MSERQYNYHRPRKVVRPVTQKYLQSILDYNPKTGIWRWKHSPNISKRRTTMFGGQRAGHIGKMYHVIKIDGRECLAHRLAVLYEFGEVPVRLKLKKFGRHSSMLSNIAFFPKTTKRMATYL